MPWRGGAGRCLSARHRVRHGRRGRHGGRSSALSLHGRPQGKGRKEASPVCETPSRVSSVCNDVVGDICGIVSRRHCGESLSQLQRSFSRRGAASPGVTALISGTHHWGQGARQDSGHAQRPRVVYCVDRCALYTCFTAEGGGLFDFGTHPDPGRCEGSGTEQLRRLCQELRSFLVSTYHRRAGIWPPIWARWS